MRNWSAYADLLVLIVSLIAFSVPPVMNLEDERQQSRKSEPGFLPLRVESSEEAMPVPEMS